MEEIERTQIEQGEQSATTFEQTEKLLAQVQQLESAQQNIHSQLEVMKAERKALDAERQAMLKTKAKLELELNEQQNALKRANNTQASAQQQLAALDEEIAEKQSLLEKKLLPQFEQVRPAE